MEKSELIPQIVTILHAALDKKAENLRVLKLPVGSAISDYFVLCSAQSDRQVMAIAEGVEEQVRLKFKRKPLSRSGQTGAQWVLLDYGDWMVHVFHHTARDHYDLEGVWTQAERITIPQEIYETAIAPQALPEGGSRADYRVSGRTPTHSRA